MGGVNMKQWVHSSYPALLFLQELSFSGITVYSTIGTPGNRLLLLLFLQLLCFSHLEGDLLSYEYVLGNMLVAFFKHGSTISEVHYCMPWIPFVNM